MKSSIHKKKNKGMKNIITKWEKFNEINNFDIDKDKKYQKRIENIFKKYENETINIKKYEDYEIKLNIQCVWNVGVLTIYVSSPKAEIHINGYSEGTGIGLSFSKDVFIYEESANIILKLLKDIKQYIKSYDNYDKDVEILKKRIIEDK